MKMANLEEFNIEGDEENKDLSFDINEDDLLVTLKERIIIILIFYRRNLRLLALIYLIHLPSQPEQQISQ